MHEKYTIQWKPTDNHLEVTIPELDITVSTQPGETSKDAVLDAAHRAIEKHMMERRESQRRERNVSTVKTYLTLVWRPSEDEWWNPEFDPLGEEEREGVTEVKDLGIRLGEPIIEEHIALPLLAPLTPAQLQGLEELKQGGWFSDFYVCKSQDSVAHPQLM